MTLQFERYDVTLTTPDGEFKGSYHWITPEAIALRLGRYTLDPETEPLPCPTLPTVFTATCQQSIISGYPAPLVATPLPQVPADPYPAPMPPTVYTDALYQGIEGEYGIVVSRTTLTLRAPTGEEQAFRVAP